MAQRVQVMLVCDLHGDETPASQTLEFALDGAAYEIDLCDEHAGQLRDGLAGFVGVARRVRGGARCHRTAVQAAAAVDAAAAPGTQPASASGPAAKGCRTRTRPYPG